MPEKEVIKEGVALQALVLGRNICFHGLLQWIYLCWTKLHMHLQLESAWYPGTESKAIGFQEDQLPREYRPKLVGHSRI
jgi:hypothetical protein